MTDRDAPRSSPSWQLFLGLLGASAGLTFLLYAVGDVVEARRFDTLVLPGAQTVAPLSHDSLIAVGGRTLGAPLLGALGSSALLVVLVAVSRVRPRVGSALVAAVLALVAAVAVALAAGHNIRWENAGFVFLVEVAATLGWLRLRSGSDGVAKPLTTARAAAIVGLGVALIAAVVVLVHVWRPPVDLEYATVDLSKGGRACGIYLALTSDDLFLAPARHDGDGYHTLRRIVVLPRTDVVRITLMRKTHVWDAGAQAASSLENPACAKP